MILLVKFLYFSISFWGYGLWAARKWRIRCEFFPILYCATVSNLLFLAGILNLMPMMVLILWGGGYVALVFSLKKGVSFQKRELCFYAAFCAVLVYFSWLLRGSRFISYDNFSHWVVVVKDMLLTDLMPNFEDSLIEFQAYPLGSSLFLYYIGKLLGTVDACLIWGQMFLSLSAIFSIAAFLNKKTDTAFLYQFFSAFTVC